MIPRLAFTAAVAAFTFSTYAADTSYLRASKNPVPTPDQLAWQDAELGMFIHFDIEVFDDYSTHARPPGASPRPYGAIPASAFNPAALNTDQWLQTAKNLGANYAVFTAKHSSGFLMWQSDLYPYGVRQSPWRGGKGDVVRDYIASCRKFGIEPGVYCSAGGHSWWNLHHGPVKSRKGVLVGSDDDVKNFINMDLSMYRDLFRTTGPLFYVWLDGGANPLGSAMPDILAQYEPHAVVFNGPRGGAPAGLARWSGNEKGAAPYPLWNTIDISDDQLDRTPGDPAGKYWIPVESNVPLRYHEWIWKADDQDKILSLSTLMAMYLATVGHGSNFIINANIGPDGLIPAADAQRLKEFGDTIRKWFGTSIAETTGTGNVVELDLPQPSAVDFVTTMEDISQGQRVRAYQIDGLVNGAWQKLCDGQSIGHKRIQQFDRKTVSSIRLSVTGASAPPVIRKLAVYNIDPLPPAPDNPMNIPGVAPKLPVPGASPSASPSSNH